MGAPVTRESARRSLRARVLARAYEVLADAGDLTDPLTVTVSDESATVTVTVTPAGGAFDINSKLSPLERQIAEVLAGGPAKGRTVASRIHQPYSTTLKVILGNMVNRGVLAVCPDGYRLN